jgi:hypothetical protein
MRMSPQSRWLAVPVFLALVVDLGLKAPADMSEGLWACYWASAMVAIGILFRVRTLVAAGLLFQFAVGLPSWALGMFYTGRVYPTSILVHIIPAMMATAYVWRLPRFPHRATLMACCIFPVALLVSIPWTPPALNVNFAHQVWPPLEDRGMPLQVFHLLLMIAAVVLIWGLRTAIELRRLWRIERNVRLLGRPVPPRRQPVHGRAA